MFVIVDKVLIDKSFCNLKVRSFNAIGVTAIFNNESFFIINSFFYFATVETMKQSVNLNKPLKSIFAVPIRKNFPHWQPRFDSNEEVTESKSVALPFGYGAIFTKFFSFSLRCHEQLSNHQVKTLPLVGTDSTALSYHSLKPRALLLS